jgi:hypothetical protein
MKERLAESDYRGAAMPLRHAIPAGRRARLATAAAVLTCALAALSAATSFGRSWDNLSEARARDEALTEQERERTPITAIPLNADILDFYRANLRPGDRVYFHVIESGFSATLDYPTAVATAGRFWLLPAVQVEDVDDATVVVSWERDPSELDVRFSEHVRAGQQLLWVSRIAS